ncbi:hypothetical protein VPHK460_0196 [Vibrio phage K460]
MLTKEQKWMNRLQRCLKDIPSGCELLVNLSGCDESEVSLIKLGTMQEEDDLMFLNITEDLRKADDFSIKRVIACSENI